MHLNHLSSRLRGLALAPLLWTVTAAQSATNVTVPTVTVRNGSYYGAHLDSYKQDLFLGIPFAKPPIGERRFANPVPMSNSSWSGARSATNYAFQCIQNRGGPSLQSEDCLYLNVVRPSGYENASLPVAVYIHGGGFGSGGTSNGRYNVSFIVQNSVSIGKPIIAASITYRLGLFGFLNGKTTKDLRCIGKENIAAFGGDPEKVTIWGESAGAASVGLQLTAFNGRDDKLFRAAIMESGGPIFIGQQQKSDFYQPMFESLLSKSGCGDSSDSIACLKEVPFPVLNSLLNGTALGSGWWPSVDGDFVARFGSEQLADGSFVHVPIIIGANSDEGAGFSPMGINTKEDLVKVINNTWSSSETTMSSLVTAYLGINASDYLIPSSDTLGGDLTYGAPLGAFFRRSAAYTGDLLFIAGRRLTCSTWAAAGLPAYCYRFNAVPTGVPSYISASHSEHTTLVFSNLEGLGYAISPFTNKTESYFKLSELMSKSWVSFVSDLNPNGWEGRNWEVESWPVYNAVRGGNGGGECGNGTGKGNGPWDIVWDANVTSHVERDTFREAGMKAINENWKVAGR